MASKYRIVVLDLGPYPKRALARVRDFTGFSSAKADWFANHLPLPVLDGIENQEIATEIKRALEQAGASVEIQNSRARWPMMIWVPEYDNLAFVTTQLPPRPYSFTWLLQGQLAGMARPVTLSDLNYLREIDVDLVISLTESPLPPEFQEHLRAEFIHLPVRDLGCPTDAQISKAVDAISKTISDGGKVVVHCGAGMGRTGVILACYLVHSGLPPDRAINELRARRPGSIETLEQEQCVRNYAERITQRKPGEKGRS